MGSMLFQKPGGIIALLDEAWYFLFLLKTDLNIACDNMFL